MLAAFILLFLIISVIYGAVIEFYSKHWRKLKKFTPTGQNTGLPISVIIPVRNEIENIVMLLNSLSALNYPKENFEVIIIDDHSTDNTPEVLSNPDVDFNLRFFKLADYLQESGGATEAYKKKAIELGISFASHELIVTTDADCVFHAQWLSSIAEFYSVTENVCIAAPVMIGNGISPLNIFQVLDFITLQGITGASVHSGKHVMANGANFIYKKSVFYEVGGFKGVDNLPSGDDMLLMQKIKKKYPGQVAYLKCKEAIVETKGMESVVAFLQQRIRWASKSKSYSEKSINRILALVFLYNLFFIILTVLVFFNPILLFLLLLFLMAKILIEFPFVHSVAKFFNKEAVMKFFIPMQPFHIIYTVAAGVLGLFGKYTWKGRKI